MLPLLAFWTIDRIPCVASNSDAMVHHNTHDLFGFTNQWNIDYFFFFNFFFFLSQKADEENLPTMIMTISIPTNFFSSFISFDTSFHFLLLLGDFTTAGSNWQIACVQFVCLFVAFLFLSLLIIMAWQQLSWCYRVRFTDMFVYFKCIMAKYMTWHDMAWHDVCNILKCFV